MLAYPHPEHCVLGVLGPAVLEECEGSWMCPDEGNEAGKSVLWRAAEDFGLV